MKTKGLQAIKLEKRYRRVDFFIVISLLLLFLISCIMVYSASMIGNKYGMFSGGIQISEKYFLIRQFLWAIVSFLSFILFSMGLPFELLKNKKILRYTFIITVILMLIPFMFSAINGAHSWIRLGFINIQPSTFAQIFTIIYTSYILSIRKTKLRSECGYDEILSIFFLPLVILGLTYIQNDTGTVLITLSILVIMAFCSNMSFSNIKKLIFIGVAGFLAILTFLFVKSFFVSSSGYQINRFKVFLHPFSESNIKSGASDQIINSFIAFGNGGLTGSGLGNSIQKLGYLPEAHTDFIMAIIAEEFGLLGIIVVLLLLGVIIYKSLYVGLKSKDTFQSMFGIGFSALLIVQIIINVGGITASLPMTGVPLPFVSNGGSSLLALSICLGIIANMLAHIKYTKGIN